MVRIWIEEADHGFVDADENLMEGEICLRAVKAFASSNSDDDDVRFLGAGALVQRPSSSLCNTKNNLPICDAWIADSDLDEPNIQVQGAQLLLDDLFQHHLTHIRNTIETDNVNNKDDNNWWGDDCLENIVSSFVVQNNNGDGGGGDKGINCEYHCASFMAAISRGFIPLSDWMYNDYEKDDTNHNYNHDNKRVGLLTIDDEYNTDALLFDIRRYRNLILKKNKNDTDVYFYEYTSKNRQAEEENVLKIAVTLDPTISHILKSILLDAKKTIQS